jgi:hypothetical protein
MSDREGAVEEEHAEDRQEQDEEKPEAQRRAYRSERWPMRHL